MEQRLQDHLANFFNPISGMGMGVGEMPPYSHYPAHYPYQVGFLKFVFEYFYNGTFF